MKSIGTSEISVCPFCGFDDLQIDETDPMMFSIICPDCGCIGPPAGIITDAIERWNERAVTPNVK
ncbi:MAG: Lar family restriction alleviation protein [Rhodocyclaceae bacterium]|nr:Lar family restriction alleviation protein [Rhodocyclaceae bacterium]